MNMTINFTYTEEYKKSSRAKKTAERQLDTSAEITIKELKKEDFPTAMTVKEYGSICKGAKSYEDINSMESSFELYSEAVRYYDGRFFKPLRVTYGACIGDPMNKEQVREHLVFRMRSSASLGCDVINTAVDDTVVVVSTTLEKRTADLNAYADDIIFYNNMFWERCGEPRYYVTTFGLGNNHGGTGFFISYGERNSVNSVFSALEREEAISYAIEVAKNRGDTESVKCFEQGVKEKIVVHLHNLVTTTFRESKE